MRTQGNPTIEEIKEEFESHLKIVTSGQGAIAMPILYNYSTLLVLNTIAKQYPNVTDSLVQKAYDELAKFLAGDLDLD